MRAHVHTHSHYQSDSEGRHEAESPSRNVDSGSWLLGKPRVMESVAPFLLSQGFGKNGSTTERKA